MRQDFVINIIGKQYVDNEEDKIEVMTLGHYTEKNGHRYIIYRNTTTKTVIRKRRQLSRWKAAEKSPSSARGCMSPACFWSLAGAISAITGRLRAT